MMSIIHGEGGHVACVGRGGREYGIFASHPACMRSILIDVASPLFNPHGSQYQAFFLLGSLQESAKLSLFGRVCFEGQGLLFVASLSLSLALSLSPLSLSCASGVRFLITFQGKGREGAGGGVPSMPCALVMKTNVDRFAVSDNMS